MMDYSRHWRRTIPFAVVAFSAIAAHGQGFGFGGPSGPGAMKPPPGMAANMKAWQTWGSNHKNVRALEHTLRGLQTVSRAPQTRLSRDQARKILAIVTPWQGKPVMSDGQAKQVNHQIQAVLTPAQKNKIAAFRSWGGPGGPPPPGGPGGPRPGGMGGPPPDGFGGPPPGSRGGPPPNGFGPQGTRPGFRPPAFPKPKEFNPLNPGTIAFLPERQRAKRDLDSLISALKHTK